MDHLELFVKAFVSGALLYGLVTAWRRSRPLWATWSALKQKLARWGFRLTVLAWGILSVSVALDGADQGLVALFWGLGFAAPLALTRKKNGEPSASASPGLAPAKELIQKVKASRQPTYLQLAQVPLPVALESTHMLLLDPQGGRRADLLSPLLSAWRERGDTVIITDRGGQLLRQHFNRETDFVFNPFDQRCVGWLPTLEVHDEQSAQAMARAMLPDNPDVELLADARALVAGVLTSLHESGRLAYKDFLYHVQVASSGELSVLLQGTPLAHTLTDEAQFQAIRTVLSTYLVGYDHLLPAKEAFCVSEMVQAEHSGVLFLPYLPEQLPTCTRTMACLLDTALRAMLGQAESTERRVWVILDDLGALSKVQSLHQALAEVGPLGGCLVLGLDTLEPSLAPASQVPPEAAFEPSVLLAHTGVQLARAGMDVATAKRLSAGFGQETAPARRALLPRKAPQDVASGPRIETAQLQALQDDQAVLKLGARFAVAVVSVPPVAERPSPVAEALRARNFTAEPLLRLHPRAAEAAVSTTPSASYASTAAHSPPSPSASPSASRTSSMERPGHQKPRPLMSASGSGSPLAGQGAEAGRLSGYRKYEDFTVATPADAQEEAREEQETAPLRGQPRHEPLPSGPTNREVSAAPAAMTTQPPIQEEAPSPALAKEDRGLTESPRSLAEEPVPLPSIPPAQREAKPGRATPPRTPGPQTPTDAEARGERLPAQDKPVRKSEPGSGNKRPPQAARGPTSGTNTKAGPLRSAASTQGSGKSISGPGFTRDALRDLLR